MNLKNNPVNLAELFARFAAYNLQQRLAGAYDQRIGLGQPESELVQHFEQEKVKGDERGWHHKDYSGKNC